VASRLGSVLLDDPVSPRAQQYNEQEEEEQTMDFEHGFSLEYVIQIVRPGQGPHVMEVHLKGAQLQWPYVTQMDFVWDLANAYKHYFVRDWVAPYPEVMMPLVNVTTLLQSPHSSPMKCWWFKQAEATLCLVILLMLFARPL